MFLAATLGQLLASTCNPMLSAQVFLRLGNHAALFTGVVPNEHLVLLLLYYAHQL